MIRFIAYAWFGLLVGVSFVATPIKFRASSLTLPVALDVGRATFHAFRVIELILGAVLVGLVAAQARAIWSLSWAPVVATVVIVGLQAFYVLPRLDTRVAMTIAGMPPPGSPLHAIYAAMDLTKALSLIAVGAWAVDRF